VRRRVNQTGPENHMLAVLGSIASLCVLAIGVMVFAAYQVRARYEQQAALTVENSVGLLAQSIASEFARSDIVLKSVVMEMEARLAAGNVDRDGINDYIARLAKLHPELFAIRVVEPDGRVRYGVDQSGKAIAADSSVNVSDRDYFKQARDQEKPELVFTPPFMGRVIVTPVMQLVRRFSGPDGRFAGITYVAFDIETLNRLVRSVNLGPNGLSSLRMYDHTLVARYSPSGTDSSQIGKKMVDPDLAEALARNPESGLYRAISPDDGRPRTFAYRKVEGYPGYVLAGIAVSDIASGRWEDFLGLVVAVPIFLIAGAIGVRRARTVNRRLEEQYTTALMNASGDAALLIDGDGFVLAANAELAGRFGLSAEELVGKAFFELLPPDLALSRRAACGQAMASGESVCLVDEREGLILENLIYPVRDTDGRYRRVAVYSRDITQRCLAEKQLVQLKEQYQQLFNDSPDAYLIMSFDQGRILDCNRATEILLGGERSAIIGKSPDQLSPFRQPDGRTSAESIPEKIAAALKTGHHCFEWVHRRLDGTDIWVEVTLSVSTYNGRRVALVAWRDISGRKQAEARLAESELRFRSLVEGTSDWVWETDADNRFSWFSDSFESTQGFPSSRLIGKRRWEGASQDQDGDTGIWQQHMEDLAARRPFRDFRYWIRAENGKPRWISVNGAPRFEADGTFSGYRGSASDITEKAEQALRLRMLSTAVEQSPVSVFITDTDGRIEYVNRAFILNTGYGPEEVIGRTPRILASGDTSQETYRQMWQTISSGRPWSGEICNRHKNGEKRWDMVSIAPIQNDFGQIIQYVALEEDITERRELQESLRRINAELEQFAYVASHDLRQPLRMITSYLGLIGRQMAEQMNDEQKSFLAFATNGAKRLDALILGLLEYSRTGQFRAMAPVDLGDVVRDALLNLTIAIQEAGGEVQIDGDLPMVSGDRLDLLRLFQNLIGNAVKYHVPGRPPLVEVSCHQEANEWIISFKDNGIGIAREDKDRVFSIFQRLVTGEEYEGTGIGLAICKKIVEQHGGRIWLDSEPGVGTTFHVALPAAI
jgi:PAS domain S-box-containing protein